MKILVLSDSHSALSFMTYCVRRLQPDAVFHLGDHYDDGESLAEQFPGLRLYQVPGNCDRYRTPPGVVEVMLVTLDGVRFYLTHGHRHFVKTDTYALKADARKARADAALYGHTHVAACNQEPDGLWVLNPGSCGYFGGSAALIETTPGRIVSCRILRDSDL